MSKVRKIQKALMFTVVELLTVMAILAILMAMGLGVYSLASNKMARSRTEALINKIAAALENYKAEHGYYLQNFTDYGFYLDTPTTTAQKDDFTDFIDYEQIKNNDTTQTGIGYALVDGFGNFITYRCPGTHNRDSFDISSPGSNSTTTDDDITNY